MESAATVNVMVLPSADLQLTSNATAQSPNTNVSYNVTLTAHNNGSQTNQQTYVHVHRTSQHNVGDGCAESGGSCQPPPPLLAGGVLTCDIGSLISGGSATVVLTLNTSAAGNTTHSAGIRGNLFDHQPANNIVNDVTTVQ